MTEAQERAKIKRLVLPKRPVKFKPSPKWYSKKRVTVNSKLRQAIIDAMPFSVNVQQADVILHAIFDTIIKGMEEDGFVTITGLGRFGLRLQPARWYAHFLSVPGIRGSKYIGKRWAPDKYVMGFRPTAELNRSMRAWEREHGDTGEDSGA